jgi:hypothetical protein
VSGTGDQYGVHVVGLGDGYDIVGPAQHWKARLLVPIDGGHIIYIRTDE